MSKISVIIPTYNIEKYVAKSIKSVLKQTYKNIQVIVVDDKSTDSTYNICKRLSKKDNRLMLVSTDHKGVSAARNVGLSYVTGEYVMFLDGDDWLPFDSLENLHKLLVKNNADLSLGAMYTVSAYKNTKRFIPLAGTFDMNNLSDKINTVFNFETPLGYVAAKLFKTEIILHNQIYFDETMKCYEDACFVYSYLKHTKNICACEQPVYYYNRLIMNVATRSFQKERAFWDYKKNCIQFETVKETQLNNKQIKFISRYYLKGFWIICKYYCEFRLSHDELLDKIQEIYSYYADFISKESLITSNDNNDKNILLYSTGDINKIINNLIPISKPQVSNLRSSLRKFYTRLKIFKYYHR